MNGKLGQLIELPLYRHGRQNYTDVSIVYEWSFGSTNGAYLYMGIEDNINKPACQEAASSSISQRYTLTFARTLTIPGCYHIFAAQRNKGGTQKSPDSCSKDQLFDGNTIGAIFLSNRTGTPL